MAKSKNSSVFLRIGAFAAALAFAGLAPAAVHAQAAPQGQADVALEPLRIVTAGGPRDFSVEVMRDDQQRARGLMFRRSLGADRGMLFDFKVEQPVMMWMKNTYIPLDMIFIARDGKIVNVAENTEPLSERTIPSGGPAWAVLEVNGGVAAKLGVKKGDRVEHGLFK